MILSKEDLSFALWNTSSFKHDGFTEALEALDEDALEIEGYERISWIKFDPSDPKTFPEHESLVLMCRKDGVVCFGHFFNGDEKLSYWGHEVTHWRQLPPPPMETGVQK